MKTFSPNENNSYSSTFSPNSTYIRAARRGKHKIFIGMAPGVGKTYRMLDEAWRLNCHGKASNGNVCSVHERILVCVSTEPNSLRLVRRVARLADYMNASVYVLFVKNTEHFLTKAEALHLETCERL